LAKSAALAYWAANASASNSCRRDHKELSGVAKKVNAGVTNMNISSAAWDEGVCTPKAL